MASPSGGAIARRPRPALPSTGSGEWASADEVSTVGGNPNLVALGVGKHAKCHARNLQVSSHGVLDRNDDPATAPEPVREHGVLFCAGHLDGLTAVGEFGRAALKMPACLATLPNCRCVVPTRSVRLYADRRRPVHDRYKGRRPSGNNVVWSRSPPPKRDSWKMSRNVP